MRVHTASATRTRGTEDWKALAMPPSLFEHPDCECILGSEKCQLVRLLDRGTCRASFTRSIRGRRREHRSPWCTMCSQQAAAAFQYRSSMAARTHDRKLSDPRNHWLENISDRRLESHCPHFRLWRNAPHCNTGAELPPPTRKYNRSSSGRGARSCGMAARETFARGLSVSLLSIPSPRFSASEIMADQTGLEASAQRRDHH